MKVGDLVKIKNPFEHPVGAYHPHLFDEIMLVVSVQRCLMGVSIDPTVHVVCSDGAHSFPTEDLEVVQEAIEYEIEQLSMALADGAIQ